MAGCDPRRRRSACAEAHAGGRDVRPRSAESARLVRGRRFEGDPRFPPQVGRPVTGRRAGHHGGVSRAAGPRGGSLDASGGARHRRRHAGRDPDRSPAAILHELVREPARRGIRVPRAGHRACRRPRSQRCRRVVAGCSDRRPLGAAPTRQHHRPGRYRRRHRVRNRRLARADRCSLRAPGVSRIKEKRGVSMKVGFIGLGHMGAGMAANLVKAGHDVTVYNRTRRKVEALVAQGAKAAASVSDTCSGDAVITMLADDDAVESVVFSDGGIIGSLPAAAIHISSSTISVALSERLEAAHAKAGQRFVAAPVFGRPDVAAAGQLFVVAAGAPDAVKAAAPLFDAIGKRTFVVSETPKAANLVKLSGNFLLASVIESLGEAMALIGKAGIDRRQYLDILTSTLFDAPVYRTYGGLIADGQFEPAGFAAPL